jgi:ribonuclease VapC
MVIDSSAFLAILLGEPEEAAFIAAIAADRDRLASAATMLETSMVLLSRKGEAAVAEFRAFSTRASVEAVPFSPEQVELALDAFRRFGKRRHAAALNFGDCFSYALAKATGQPLLFKGGDFALTDLASAPTA